MNIDTMPETKVIYTTHAMALEDFLLALEFAPGQKGLCKTFEKEGLLILLPIETYHYSASDPEAYIALMKSQTNADKVILVFQSKENTSGSWVIDPETGKRTSRNLQDLVGSTYDEVMNPNQPWKYYAKV